MSAPDRYCDIVMKGGITSGIVYPFAISKLSTEYSFKSIGGTSAGAIAAAAAAAAEYRRRHTGTDAGFQELDHLPNELSLTDDAAGRSKLLRLFHPQAETQSLFMVLLSALGRRSMASRLVHLVLAGWAWFPASSLIGAVLAGGLAWLSCRPSTPAAWLPVCALAVMGALAGLAVAVYRSVTVDLAANGFGLCRGHNEAPRFTAVNGQVEADEELTGWLHGLINRIAGRGAGDAPLTFGELWSAPGFPPAWLAGHARRPPRSIDLQMMTTNVTHGRPYKLPFNDPDARLFFRPDELRRYFPPAVSRWLEERAARYAPSTSDPRALPQGLLALPAAADLPVVVAARLSLSFPLLISAVPLWAIDYEAPREERAFRRCWFSDGGISSNFPVHFFDDLLPLWPTFGIKLEGFPKGYGSDPDNRIYMPFRNVEGRADAWSRFDEMHGFARVKGFVSAIVDSMMSWNDNTLARASGYRDRIVRVRLREDEGGMNLGMDDEKIATLSNLGDFAAEEILERFVREEPVGPYGERMGWENHRWVRLRSLAAMIEQAVPGLRAVAEVAAPGAPPYPEQTRTSMERDEDQYPLRDPAQVALLLRAIDGISELAEALRGVPETQTSAPQPLPALRVRPNL